MIALSTQYSNMSGFVIIDELALSESEKREARVSRSSTLDGGVSIKHYGVSTGDRIISISSVVNERDADIIKTLFLNETFLNIALADGFYQGVIKDFQNDNGTINLTLYIKDSV